MVEMKDISIRTPIAIVPDQAMATIRLANHANMEQRNSSSSLRMFQLYGVLLCDSKPCSLLGELSAKPIRHKTFGKVSAKRTPIAIVPDQAMATHTQELEKRANSLLSENGSPERKVLIAKHQELAARQWLGTVKTDVLDQIKRLKTIETLKTLQKTTVTNKITTLGNSVPVNVIKR
jgi:hypothetical protein